MTRLFACVGGERPADGHIAGECLFSLLTCLPQVCQGRHVGFERMQKMADKADNTTQHCRRLAPQNRRPRRRPEGPRSGWSIRSGLVAKADRLLEPARPTPPPRARDRVSKQPVTPDRSSSRIYHPFAISAADDLAAPFDIHTHRTTLAQGGVRVAVRAQPSADHQHYLKQPEYPAQEKHGYRDPVPIPKPRRSTL